VIGQSVGNYVVTRKLGEGGMGAVYLAEHPKIGRQVAIKVLLPDLSQRQDVVARFFQEARTASEIKNEHIIDVLDFGQLPDGSFYLVMEFVDGAQLKDVLARGALPIPRALRIALGIGRALAAAHGRAIVHRDLKPDNVMLLHRPNHELGPDFVKVLDFGIAKLLSDDQVVKDVKTKTGALIGTPAYMSPEQARGMRVDHRSDIYSLGVILYQMVSGQLPFIADGLGELLLAQMTKPPRPLATVAPHVPAKLAAIIHRCLEKDPEARFRYVEELLNLLALEAGLPAQYTLPDNKTQHSSRTTLGGAAGQRSTKPGARRRSSGTTVLLAVAGVVLVGGVAVGVVKMRGGEAPVAPPRPPTPTPTPALTPAPTPTPIVAGPTPMPTPAPPPTPPPSAPEGVALRIRTTPPEAELTLDGARLQNPFSGAFPKSALRRQLVARAPGYRTSSQWIALDRPQEIAVRLEPDRPAAPKPPTGGAQKTTNGATSTPAEERPVYKGTRPKILTTFPDE
jgi:serine/threonine-protein kinase